MAVRSDADIIKSYLVSLSANADVASFAKLDGVLKAAETGVRKTMGSMAASFLTYQIAATSAFATVGFSIIGYIDHLAMLDQRQKLNAMQNMMSVQQYRAVSMALDVMGVSLDDVFFGTKQMQQQFHTLIDDQKQLAAMIGPDYEKQMETVRDVHFQLARLELKGEYFGMKFATDLLHKLGFGDDGIILQLERLNDWVMAKMPGWSDEISGDVIPVLKDLWGMLEIIGGGLKEAGNQFTNFEGAITGDNSLKTKTTDFHQFATAVGDVVRQLAELLNTAMTLEGMGYNFLGAVGHGLKGGWDRLAHPTHSGDAKVGQDTKAAQADIHAAWQSLIDGSNNYWAIHDGMTQGPTPTQALSGFNDKNMAAVAMMAAQRVSKDTGIPADLIFGQFGHETGGFTNRGSTSLNNLAGIRIPGSKEYQSFSSIDAFASYYERVLGESRYTNQGIMAARTPEAFAHALKGGGYYEGPEKDYAGGVSRYSKQAPNLSVTVQVQNMHNSTPDDVAAAAQRGASRALDYHNEKNMVELNGAYQ
jgi:hypothetical protein